MIRPVVSVCIPVYEMSGIGIDYLEYSFNILYSQTFKDFEIVISDHSIDTAIKDLCDQWAQILNIKYLKNDYKRGVSSANINNAIKHATGDIIKILFQDDFLYDEYSLENQVNYFTLHNGHWLIAACCHYDGINIHKPFYPTYHDEIQYGQNTISSPSVLMFKNKNVIEFDENLFWLMDVDYYKRLFNKFGLPIIYNQISVVNREHLYQVSNTLATENRRQQELKYIITKYNKHDTGI
jgi:glycosyltransferase involved in cell wall biosynthesis